MTVVENDNNLTPDITVYMPTKNRAKLMKRAAKSVLRQTFTNFELLIVDDHSTDETATVLTELAKDSRVRIFRNPSRGACSARNFAIQQARAKYITGLDDDDYFTPERLALFYEQRNRDVSFLCASSTWCYGHFQRVIDGKPGAFSLSQQLSYNEASNQVFVLTQRLREIGGFDESFVACQDYDTWTRLMIRYGSAYRLPTPTYVVDDNSGFQRMIDNPKSVRGYQQFWDKHHHRMSKDNELNHQFMRWVRIRHRLTLMELLPLLTASRRTEKIRYFLSSNFPYIAACRHRLLTLFKR